MNKQVIYDFMEKNEHAVIATSNPETHQPESALVGFGQTKNLELVFGTFNTSRKYANLLQNNKVSFVIGWDNDYINVQYEGSATEIFGEEKDTLVQMYHQKVPSAAHYDTYPQQRYFKVTPTWIRYSDLSGEDEKIIELTF